MRSLSQRAVHGSLRAIVVAWAVAAMAAASGCGSLIVTQKSVEALEGRRGFTWTTHEVDDFVIYVEAGSDASRETDAIAADARSARVTVLRYLQEPLFEPTVSLFVVDSRDRMQDLIGRRSQATAYYTSNAICYVWSNALKVGATHELLHIVAMNLWGVPERWINEGAAVDARGRWLGHDVHAVCKHLRAGGDLPSLPDITRRFEKLPGLASYPAAGSFVRYLRETYGLAAVRAVWDGGRRALPEATGVDLGTLESAWLDVVEQADARDIDYGL